MAKAQSQTTLGDYLVREGIISNQQFSEAMEQQRETSRSLGRILVDRKIITEGLRISVLQKQFGFDLVRLGNQQIDPILLHMIPYSFAEKHRVVPVRQDANQNLLVAMEDPSDILLLDALKNQVGMGIRPVIASGEDIQKVLDQYQTGVEQERAEAAAHPPLQNKLWYRILKVTAFPVLALLPLVLFFVFLYYNTFELADRVQTMQEEGSLTKFDFFIYFALFWGLWAIILFEIDGLIFGKGRHDEEAEI